MFVGSPENVYQRVGRAPLVERGVRERIVWYVYLCCVTSVKRLILM